MRPAPGAASGGLSVGEYVARNTKVRNIKTRERGCRKSLRQNGNTLACASGQYTLVRSQGRRTAHASEPAGRPPALCWIMVRAATNTRSARVSRPRRNA
jgi:hypothetical protein